MLKRVSKFYLIFLVFTSIQLLAYDYNQLTDYKTNGIKNIQKKLDYELSKEEYWDNFLNDKETTFGYIESYSNILTCNKEKSKLNLYKRVDNKFVFQKEYDAFTGKEKGDKKRKGDLRTPLGIYKLTKKISKLDSFYGPLAFVTSYPNLFDSYKGKDGYGIWIHGLPKDQNRDKFTKGCIAINNKNIECLDRHIDITNTLLIIDEDEFEKNISKNKISLILSQLYLWRYSWIYNDIDIYLSFYSNNFVRDDGMNKKRFSKYKKRIFAKNEDKTIKFADINVIPYPKQKDVFEITFKEFYHSKSYSFIGDKTLLVKINSKNKIRIFTER